MWNKGLLLAVAILACMAPLRAQAAPSYSEQQVFELLEVAAAEQEPEARRARAIRELAHTDVRTHMATLRRLMRQERSLDIRLSAACTLSALGDSKAPKDLLLASAYDFEHTPNCSRSDVLIALGRTRDPAAELHLERALKLPPPPDEPDLHEGVCRALGLLGTPGARRILIGVLRDGSPNARYAATHPLSLPAEGRRADPEAVAALVRAARTDPEERVAEQALAALFWNGADGNAFYRLLEQDPEPAVRARAARVLNRHYLSPARLERLRAAFLRERHPDVMRAMRQTLEGQRPPRQN